MAITIIGLIRRRRVDIHMGERRRRRKGRGRGREPRLGGRSAHRENKRALLRAATLEQVMADQQTKGRNSNDGKITL
jgi:hypothetical protein